MGGACRGQCWPTPVHFFQHFFGHVKRHKCSTYTFIFWFNFDTLISRKVLKSTPICATLGVKMLDIEGNATGKKGRRSRRYSQRSPAGGAQRREITNQVMIGETDMSPTLQSHAVLAASEALDVHQATDYKDVAFYIKNEFDKEYGTGWQCITGVSFGSYVTHSSGSFIHFCLGRIAIMLFKAAS